MYKCTMGSSNLDEYIQHPPANLELASKVRMTDENRPLSHVPGFPVIQTPPRTPAALVLAVTAEPADMRDSVEADRAR